jgi:hypothetical protein
MNILAADAQSNIWTALPTILWVTLITITLLWLRRSVSELIGHLITRIRAGAPMKIGAVEFGALRTEQLHMPAPTGESSAAPGGCSMPLEAIVVGGPPMSPEASNLTAARQAYYADTNRIMIAHRLFRSTQKGQVYDVLIYLVPHYGASLVQVSEVKYFFGRYWNNEVFPSWDRAHGYPILTSAYGTFLCCALVRFNDGSERTLFRYIDFEMGAYAPVLVNRDTDSKKLPTELA